MTESYNIIGGHTRLISHMEPRAVNGFDELGLAGVEVAYDSYCNSQGGGF